MNDAATIYLDHHATTPLDPRVLEAMLPYLTTHFANAGSASHEPGRTAKAAVDDARDRVAHCLGCDANEIVFTSGSTESNNLAIRGSAERARRKGNHVLSVVSEHPSVLDPLERLAGIGMEVTLLPVASQRDDAPGEIALDRFRDSLASETFLASVMWANNEIGALQPIAEIADLCQSRGVTLHCDATQAVGKMPINLRATGIDLLSLSAHKFYGPKGVGALFVRRRPKPVRLAPLVEGGGQEQGLRSGTLNVPGIVGLAKALEIAVTEMESEQARLARLREQLFAALKSSIPDIELNGPPLRVDERLAGNLNLHFPGVAGETIMLHTPQVAVSSGSACTSVNPEPSHVLLALGRSSEEAQCSLRFGLGRFTTEAEVDAAAKLIAGTVNSLRSAASH
jgi:cysteine desulfurase